LCSRPHAQTNDEARLCHVAPFVWLCGAGADWKVFCPDTMKVVRAIGLSTPLLPSGVTCVTELWRIDIECWELWLTAVCGDLLVVRVSGMPVSRPRRRIRYEKVVPGLESSGTYEQRTFRGGRSHSLTVDCGEASSEQAAGASSPWRETSPRLGGKSVPPHLSPRMQRVGSVLGSVAVRNPLASCDSPPSSTEVSPRARLHSSSNAILPAGGCSSGSTASGSGTPSPGRSSKHTRSFSSGGEDITQSPSSGKKKSSGLKHIKKFSRKRSGSVSRR
jgi:hypothetical protein